MEQQIKSHIDFDYPYCKYLLITILRRFCCCFVSRYDTDEQKTGWYRSNMQRIRKIQLANDML